MTVPFTCHTGLHTRHLYLSSLTFVRPSYLLLTFNYLIPSTPSPSSSPEGLSLRLSYGERGGLGLCHFPRTKTTENSCPLSPPFLGDSSVRVVSVPTFHRRDSFRSTSSGRDPRPGFGASLVSVTTLIAHMCVCVCASRTVDFDKIISIQ